MNILEKTTNVAALIIVVKSTNVTVRYIKSTNITVHYIVTKN